MNRSLFLMGLLIVAVGCSDGMDAVGADGQRGTSDGLGGGHATADGGAGAFSDALRAADAEAMVEDAGPPPEIAIDKLTLYVNLGDSIAAGYGIATGRSYPELLLANDDDEYPLYAGRDMASVRGEGTVAFADAAVVGATSTGVLSQLQDVPDNPQGETLVTIVAGGNDLLHDFQALVAETPERTEKIAAQVAENLRKIKAHFSDPKRFGKVTIVIFNLYDPTDGLGVIPKDAQVGGYCSMLKDYGALLGPKVLKNFARYNRALAAFAKEEGVILADMRGAFLGHGFNYGDASLPTYDAEDPSLWFMTDCIHPTYAGHRALRELVLSMLTYQGRPL